MVPWLVPGNVPLMTSLTGLEILVVGATGEGEERGRGGASDTTCFLIISHPPPPLLKIKTCMACYMYIVYICTGKGCRSHTLL